MKNKDTDNFENGLKRDYKFSSAFIHLIFMPLNNATKNKHPVPELSEIYTILIRKDSVTYSDIIEIILEIFANKFPLETNKKNLEVINKQIEERYSGILDNYSNTLEIMQYAPHNLIDRLFPFIIFENIIEEYYSYLIILLHAAITKEILREEESIQWILKNIINETATYVKKISPAINKHRITEEVSNGNGEIIGNVIKDTNDWLYNIDVMEGINSPTFHIYFESQLDAFIKNNLTGKFLIEKNYTTAFYFFKKYLMLSMLRVIDIVWQENDSSTISENSRYIISLIKELNPDKYMPERVEIQKLEYKTYAAEYYYLCSAGVQPLPEQYSKGKGAAYSIIDQKLNKKENTFFRDELSKMQNIKHRLNIEELELSMLISLLKGNNHKAYEDIRAEISGRKGAGELERITNLTSLNYNEIFDPFKDKIF